MRAGSAAPAAARIDGAALSVCHSARGLIQGRPTTYAWTESSPPPGALGGKGRAEGGARRGGEEEAAKPMRPAPWPLSL